jgi:hypothetical protein
MKASNAAIWVQRRSSRVAHLACQRHQSPAPKMLNASGTCGESAVPTVPLVPTITFSGPASGFRPKQPSTVVKSAFRTHRLTNLMKSRVTSLDAQFLALVIGASMTSALQSFRFQEASIVVEAQKPGLTSSLKRHSSEAQNAVTMLETWTHWIAVIVHAKSLASASSASGPIAVQHVVVAPSRESSKSLNQPSMVVPTARTTMATLRLSNAEWTHAPLIAKDHGALGPSAVNNALIARVMVPLAPSLGSTPSLCRPRMVANSAQKLITRLRRRSATTSAARRIASDHGPSSLSALPRAGMASRSAPITSPALLLMAVLNAHAVTFQATLWLAMTALAPSIVPASGQPGRIAPRSAVVVRRQRGS